MKVLQINCVYKKGSTGKITYDLHKGLLDRGVESIVCYGRGQAKQEPGVYKTCSEWYSKLNNALSRVTGIMYGGCLLSTKRLISIIQKEKPDIVHLQCINGYFVNIYRLITWLKSHSQATVLTLHAEFMYTGGCGYSIDCNQWSTCGGCGHSEHCPRWQEETRSLFCDRTNYMWNRMNKSFSEFNRLIVVSVSPWLMERAQRSVILRNMQHKVVCNSVDTTVFRFYNTKEVKKELGIENNNIVFHATPSFSIEPGHIKGGQYICELARRMPDITFFVAGPHKEGIVVPENVRLLGRITDQILLAKYYSLANITLLTSKRETFSMVTVESLCCGTPVIGFNAGGPESIAIEDYSVFIEYGDTISLTNAVRDMMNKKIDKGKIAEKASIRYGIDCMVEDYVNIYDELINRGKVLWQENQFVCYK